MASLEGYVVRVKPAMEAFLSNPTKATLGKLEHEIKSYQWVQMKIFQAQILVPLVIKLDELSGENQDFRTGIINCLRYVISKLYVTDNNGLRSILVVVLKQIRNGNSATLKPNLSEEIKLATVECIAEALRRSTTDVLEAFYTKESTVLIGQGLLTLVEFIAREKYKKLVLSSIQCLMVIFYVHDEADAADVVLRNQVADTIFLFLPKIVTVLFKTSLADDTIGESIKSLSVKALGRVLCIMFEETTNEFLKQRYDLNAFKKLFDATQISCNEDNGGHGFFFKQKSSQAFEEQLKQLQTNLRSASWITATSQKLKPVYLETSILRAHAATSIRRNYAQICCLLLERCAHNMRQNFLHILESVVAMSEDSEPSIAQQCQSALQQLQQRKAVMVLFDENVELLFDAHLTKFPRILHRCDDNEQYAELLFLKGFLRNLNPDKLSLLLLVPRNMEKFVKCLLTALDLKTTRDLLNEEYSLREFTGTRDYVEWAKLPWRQYKNLSTERSVFVLYDICTMLGKIPSLNRNIFDYCMELLSQDHPAMNELILLLTLMATGQQRREKNMQKELTLLLLEELLNDKHWHLALQPDHVWRLKVNKPTSWFVDRTPGLYESALEVRMQDCDSDDESDPIGNEGRNRVSIIDAQFNVLHTCIVLDSLSHCATFIGETFDHFVFRSLHRVLLKLASSNTKVYQAANFTFVSMQKALKYAEATHFIECSTNYLTYHLNLILKRTPESSAAVEILTVVLQFSTRSNIPYLDSIFQTIRDECAKSYQSVNIDSYLKVYTAFLQHVGKWQCHTNAEIDNVPMQVDVTTNEDSILNNWLHALNKSTNFLDDIKTTEKCINNDVNEINLSADQDEAEEMPESNAKPALPQHIEMIKDILQQVLQFISNSSQTHQILSLECLISGVPLLQDYEDELLPLVHLIWQPLVEKFRQKDALVLNRCFTLLHILGVHAKDFILKRSLNDVIPFLKQFLKEAAVHSATECLNAQTQEFKLQLKLLQNFASFIQNLQIEGKHLNDIAETVSLYLSEKQPKELQFHAIQFYSTLRLYNGPFLYLIVLKRAHLNHYKSNVGKILKVMEMK